jgi:hypothetical protein
MSYTKTRENEKSYFDLKIKNSCLNSLLKNNNMFYELEIFFYSLLDYLTFI